MVLTSPHIKASKINEDVKTVMLRTAAAEAGHDYIASASAAVQEAEAGVKKAEEVSMSACFSLVVFPNSPAVSLSLLSSAGHSLMSRHLSSIVSFPHCLTSAASLPLYWFRWLSPVVLCRILRQLNNTSCAGIKGMK